ncbi:flavoprotein [Robertmurraya korlensis]|uniref:flavoprotein n=1 Tax=Robertmurraya korlensis TaxID=519977 RepID=UPI0008255747|nr:flavoprotein [Robertmurraya korlensis]
MDLEKAIQDIVKEVIRRLNQRLKTAIVVFTGGALGFEDALEQLKTMKKEGWSFKILLTRSAEHVFLPGTIEKDLGTNEVFYEKELEGLGEFYKDTSLLIIPTLTLNSATKISLGIVDSAVTNLVSHYITTGTPIVAADDACDLKNPIREKYRMHHSPKAYLDMNSHHLEQLRAYGISLVRAKDIAEASRKVTFQFSETEEEENPVEKSSIYYTDRVLSRLAVFEAKQASCDLVVSKQTIITALAREAASEWGVSIHQER